MNYLRLMIWKEFAQIKADPLMVRLLVLPVLFQLFVIGYALTTEVRHTPLAVLDRSRSPESRALIQALRSNDLFNYKGEPANEAELRRELDAGKVRIAVVFLPDFAERIDSPDGAGLQLLIDGQDASSAQI